MSSRGLETRSPLAATAVVLGRKWHPVILRRLLEEGPLGFSALEAAIPGVSGKVLSESLADLQEKGVVNRTVLRERPTRVEYALTERGAALEPAVDELHSWGRAYLAETAEGSVDAPTG